MFGRLCVWEAFKSCLWKLRKHLEGDLSKVTEISGGAPARWFPR